LKHHIDVIQNKQRTQTGNEIDTKKNNLNNKIIKGSSRKGEIIAII